MNARVVSKKTTSKWIESKTVQTYEVDVLLSSAIDSIHASVEVSLFEFDSLIIGDEYRIVK